MDKSTESDGTNILSLIRKRNIFIGIMLLMILSSIEFFYSINPKIPSLYLTISKRVNQSREINSFTLTTTTTVSSTSQLPSKTRQINATIVNSDEILCDNMKEYRSDNNPCERIRCAIVLRSSGGRLGNRMFMFASAYGLARTQNCRLYVSASILSELRNHFQMKPIDEKLWLSEKEFGQLTNIQRHDSVCSFLPELIRPNAFKTIELVGYWQSYLYFDAYREEIRAIFSARTDALVRLGKYLTDLTNSICSTCSPLPNLTHRELRQAFRTRYNITWISIHIRRQDFLGLRYSSDENYIHRAISFFRRRYYRSQVRFLVASDDRHYCRGLFASEQKPGEIIILPDHFSPSDDLMTLSFCHHSIVTGGTFGFWSAYLAGGEVIHDIKYRTGCLRSDYYPPWFILTGAVVEKKV